MIKDKHIQLNMQRLLRRIAALLMGVIIASSMMPSVPAYAASNKSKTDKTDTEETVSTPIREVHRVKVGDKKYCFFVQHNVVLTPAQISKLSDNELAEEIVKQSGLFIKETNCRKVSHKLITYKSWLKQDHSFGLSEADLERIRSAAPSDGSPVKLHMDLGVSLEPAPEEKPTDGKTTDDKSKDDKSKDDKTSGGKSADDNASEDTGKDDNTGDNTDPGDSSSDDNKQGGNAGDSGKEDNSSDNTDNGDADTGKTDSAAADDSGTTDKSDEASDAGDNDSNNGQESESGQSDNDNKDSGNDNTDNSGTDDQQGEPDPGKDTGDDNKDDKKTDDRKFYSTSKLLSQELLFVVVATKTDAAKGEDICTLKTPDNEPSGGDIDVPDDGGEKEEMLPEYRTIQMADRSGKPLEPTLQDGTPVTLKWVEPKKTINTDEMPSFLQHIPGGIAGIIGILAAIAAATAVIIVRRRAAADGYEYEDDDDEE